MQRKIFFTLIFAALLAGCASPAQQKTEIALVANDDFTYTPASITVSAKQPVVLTIKNKGSLEHDFVIQKINLKDITQPDEEMDMEHNMAATDYDLHVTTAAGKTSVITFTPVDAGTYEFFCTVKGHKEAGMTGTMIVNNSEN